MCDFQVKVDNIKAAGYKGLIVFNRTGEDGCETLVNMLAVRTSRRSSCRARTASGSSASSPLAGYTCETDGDGRWDADARRPGRAGGHLGEFDGWGYTHMYKTDLTEGRR